MKEGVLGESLIVDLLWKRAEFSYVFYEDTSSHSHPLWNQAALQVQMDDILRLVCSALGCSEPALVAKYKKSILSSICKSIEEAEATPLAPTDTNEAASWLNRAVSPKYVLFYLVDQLPVMPVLSLDTLRP